MTPGDPIVALDRAEREDELRSLDDQIRMRMNARERARLKLANALTELRGLELERFRYFKQSRSQLE